ncbi:MAG: hypothetical protein ACYC2P_01780 [Paludibacteraceae bacterium]
MKKTFILFAILYCGISFFANGFNTFGTEASDSDIPLKRETVDPQPRSISLEFFFASYNSINNTLTITGCDYTGFVIVNIIGTNGFSTALYFDNCNSEIIDISTLVNGAYTLQIITSSGIKYTGKFVM